MTPLFAIITFGIIMALISQVGIVTLAIPERRLMHLLPLLVALASGSLIGGALFHMIPEAVDSMGNHLPLYLWIAAGFITFLVLEQLLMWHHCHKAPSEHTRPIGYLILVADGLHNLIGGIAIGALFIADVGLGITAWTAAAVHEVPQELGDFGVLVHGGWSVRRALIYNLISGLTFVVGGLVAYRISAGASVDFLVPFAAGNFLYIGAADLIPEFKEAHDGRPNIAGTLAWVLGFGIVLIVKIAAGH